MRVVLDVDGVLADFVHGALQVINRLHPHGPFGGYFVPSDVTQWEIEKLLPEHLHAELFAAFCKPGFVADLPPYEGAISIVDHLRASGHDVVIATSPWKGSDHWIPERTAWLQRYWGAIEIHHVHDKTGVRGDVFVDDKPAHVLAWAKANPTSKALLLDRPYNSADNMLDAPANVARIASLWQLYSVAR